MAPRPLLRIGGPAWEFARVVLLLLYLAAGSSAAGTPDMLSAPWLAAVGAAGLVLPAAFVLFCVSPDRHRSFLPLLRLGKSLEAATIVLLFATRAVRRGGAMPAAVFRVPLLSDPLLVFAIALALDLLVLAGLVRLREDS